MSDQLVLDRPAADGAEDSAKRRQVIEGARQVFLARGFDAASMGDIAKAAGVSKGTLYVYFKDKEELFTAIVMEECVGQAERIFHLDPADPDVEGALMRLGVAYINFMCQPQKASAVRTVIAIADRMPSIGKAFYETRPFRSASPSSPIICARRPKPACSPSSIPRSARRNSSTPARPRCSSRCCSTSPLPRRPNASRM